MYYDTNLEENRTTYATTLILKEDWSWAKMATLIYEQSNKSTQNKTSIWHLFFFSSSLHEKHQNWLGGGTFAEMMARSFRISDSARIKRVLNAEICSEARARFSFKREKTCWEQQQPVLHLERCFAASFMCFVWRASFSSTGRFLLLDLCFRFESDFFVPRSLLGVREPETDVSLDSGVSQVDSLSRTVGSFNLISIALFVDRRISRERPLVVVMINVWDTDDKIRRGIQNLFKQYFQNRRSTDGYAVAIYLRELVTRNFELISCQPHFFSSNLDLDPFGAKILKNHHWWISC